ncbi:MAG: GTPase [Myxococcaceae bacterium]
MDATARIRASLESSLAALPAPEALRDVEAQRTVRRLRERLTRDLLPRLAGEHPTLLVGIAGPNNAGKSSLFNALVESALSPARPEGGLTKQCLAAAHPSFWEGALKELVERRYDVVRVESAEQAKVTEPGPPGRLFLALLSTMPPGLLVMDTPDFDSIYVGNRANSEALLVTVDVLLFVISKQTYQNAALVQFLKEAVGHGRPYVLVYNEAMREEIAREHLEKLARDIGTEPLARYRATHQPEVELGQALLVMQPVGSDVGLRTLLVDPPLRAQVKAQALAASLADARSELEGVANALAADAAEPNRLRARLRRELRTAGEHAARKSVPADILIEAFQDELDERSTFNRVVRRQVRRAVGVLGVVGRALRNSFAGEPKAEAKATEAVERALREGLRQMVDSLAPEVAAWRGDAQTKALLAGALGPELLTQLEHPLPEASIATPQDRAALYKFCRELVMTELNGDEREQLLQAATTLVYALPVSAAGALSYVTGGLGQDAAVWISAAVATPVLQKLVDLLGSGIRDEVTRSWVEQHGATLGAALERAFFGPLLQRLDELVASSERSAAALREAAGKLRVPGQRSARERT